MWAAVECSISESKLCDSKNFWVVVLYRLLDYLCTTFMLACFLLYSIAIFARSLLSSCAPWAWSWSFSSRHVNGHPTQDSALLSIFPSQAGVWWLGGTTIWPAEFSENSFCWTRWTFCSGFFVFEPSIWSLRYRVFLLSVLSLLRAQRSPPFASLSVL